MASSETFCRNGRWVTQEGAVKYLGLANVKELKTLAKLGASHVHWEDGAKVGEASPPFNTQRFYYVTRKDEKATQLMTIPLVDWIFLCKEATKVLTTSNPSDESNSQWRAVASTLQPILSKYTGHALPRTTLSAIKTVLHQLEECGAILVVKPGISIPNSSLSSTKVQSTHAPPCDGTSAKKGPSHHGRAVAPKNQEKTPFKEANRSASLVRTPAGTNLTTKRVLVTPFSARKTCVGINNKRLTRYGSIDANYCLKHWSFHNGSWRSQQCDITLPLEHQGKRCDPCSADAKNVRQREHPKLFESAASATPLIVQLDNSRDTLHDMIKKVYEESTDKESFLSHPDVQRISKVLRPLDDSPIRLHDTSLCFCQGCKKFAFVPLPKLMSTGVGATAFCPQCYENERNKKKRERRYEANHEKQAGISSHTNHRFMTNEQLSKQSKARRIKTIQLQKKIDRLSQALFDEKAKVEGKIEPNLRSTLKDAIENLKESCGDSECRKDILSLLLNVDRDKLNSQQEKEAESFIQSLLHEIEKYEKVLQGKERSVRYSPEIMRLAMTLWSRSPAGYEEVRQSSFLVLPSQRTLKDDAKIRPTESWLPQEQVSVVNQVAPERRIFLWHCTTHELKCLRNQLFASQDDGAKDFRSELGAQFGWASVEALHARDDCRASKRTKMLLEAVALEGWSKMNVKFAKALFQDGTISELVEYIWHTLLGQTTPLRDQGPTAFKSPSSSRVLGRFSFYAKQIRNHVLANSSELQSRGQLSTILSELSTLEYLCAVREIFLEVFMNKTEYFTLTNIDSYETFVKGNLDFFGRWKQHQVRTEAAASTVLAPETWRNLRVAVRGFFGYARQVLHAGAKIVPVLHSNTSILESFFSQQRAMNNEKPGEYTSGVGVANMRKCGVYLLNHKGYSQDDVAEADDEDWLAFKAMNSKLDGQLKEWQGSFPSRRRLVQRFPDGMEIETKDGDLGAIVRDMAKAQIPNHFAAVLASQEIMSHYYMTSLGVEKNAAWFRNLADLDESDNVKFDDTCQAILEQILARLVMTAEKENVELEVEMHKFILSDEFKSLCEKRLPGALRTNRVCCVALTECLETLARRWFFVTLHSHTLLSAENVTKDGPKTVVEETSEVQRFLGWAIRAELDVCKDEEKRQSDSSGKTTEAVSLLERMRVLERDIEKNEQYIRKYYPPGLRILNEGGLSLVSSAIFPWGMALLKLIRQAFGGGELLRRRGNQAVNDAWTIVENDKGLRDTFYACVRMWDVDKSTLERVRIALTTRAFHARIEVDIKRFKTEHFGRLAGKYSDVGLREMLKVTEQIARGNWKNVTSTGDPVLDNLIQRAINGNVKSDSKKKATGKRKKGQDDEGKPAHVGAPDMTARVTARVEPVTEMDFDDPIPDHLLVYITCYY